MSYGFTVDLNDSVTSQLLIKDVREVAAEMLQLSLEVFKVECQFIADGSVRPSVPKILTSEEGALIFCLSSSQLSCEFSQVTIILMEREECELDIRPKRSMYAAVTVFGGGGETKPRLVTAAVCAIALARQNDSLVVDELCRWNSEREVNPRSLLKTLRCQNVHLTLESALEEVLVNVERSRGRPL